MWQENNLIEFKSELSNKFEREVIAFLNSEKGGDIYLGVDDNGKCIGVDNPDQVQLIVSDRIKNNIEPSCLGLFDVFTLEKDNVTIIRILISRGTEKPYYVKKFGMSPKGCYIRVGSGVQQMDRSMIDTAYASRTRTSLRNIVSPKSELSFEQLKIYYQEKGLNVNSALLKNLDCYTQDGHFNYVAYLLADNNTLSIKVAKYSGDNKVDLIESKEFGFCSLIKATKSILDKLQVENRTFTKITGAAEREQRDMINKVALREALINAIVHNDYSREITPVVEIYSNHLSITSYGGLVSGLSKEELFQGRSMLRNREIMRIFRDLELVEHLGSGVHRILSAYNKDIFKISDNFFEICFPCKKDTNLTHQDNSFNTNDLTTDGVLSTHQDAHQDTHHVKRLIKTIGNTPVSRTDLMNKIDIKDRVSFRLNYLQPSIELGLIEMTLPDKPTSGKQKYILTPKGLKLKEILEGNSNE